MISFDRVSKRYGPHTALQEVSFTAPRGQILGLLGQNGAGKTTAMNILTGCLAPTAGHASVGGFDVLTQPRQAKRLIGYLPEHAPLYDEMTVRAYLKFAGELKEVKKSGLKSHVEHVAERTGLGDVLDRKIGNLSKGYRQRVGVAQALCGTPEVIILDEPTAGLDPSERVRFRNIISGLSKDRIVILSTHIVSDVESVANQLVFLKDHRVAGEGSPESFCRDLRGEVFEITLPDTELPQFEQAHAVLSIRQEHNRVHLRFTGGSLPAEAAPAEPSLEDVFLVFYR